ncbi:MAG TPA: Druantia anti-phage system protein DruA [Verrucomicrobiales bacterium]|nr:Druantia anti-phage system protein DruA [Verrucomicrobiales bacterium]
MSCSRRGTIFGAAGSGGGTLRYVAEADGRWVALLSFSGATPPLKGREKWIGWSPRQRARRLALVVNNSRFLLLVERQRHPNLASKVLVCHNVSDTK